MNTEYCRIVYNSVLMHPVRGPPSQDHHICASWRVGLGTGRTGIDAFSNLTCINLPVSHAQPYYFLDYSLQQVEGRLSTLALHHRPPSCTRQRNPTIHPALLVIHHFIDLQTGLATAEYQYGLVNTAAGPLSVTAASPSAH